MEDKNNPVNLIGGEELPLTKEKKAASEPASLHENDLPAPRKHLQALIDARGIGAQMAHGEDPDEYIRQLREGWD